MSKLVKFLIVAVMCIASLGMFGCGGDKKEAADYTGPVKVGVNPGPHAEIMDNVKKLAAKEGLEIEVVEFSDFVTPNTALAQGDIWANCYQHKPFLDATLKKEPGFDLVSAFPTALFPINVYSKKIQPGQPIPDGATIAIPNDPSNGSRAILMLAENGLIKVKDIKNIDTTLQDITENPHNYKFIELEAASIPRSLEDVDCAAINTTYALEAGLNPATDAIVSETADSLYVNIVAVRKDTLKDPRLETFKKVYQSPENAKFIKEHFPGSVSIGWKE